MNSEVGLEEPEGRSSGAVTPGVPYFADDTTCDVYRTVGGSWPKPFLLFRDGIVSALLLMAHGGFGHVLGKR